MICKSSNVFLWGSWCFYDVRLKYRHLRDVDDDVARRVNDQEQMIEMSQVVRPLGPDLDCAIYEHLGKKLLSVEVDFWLKRSVAA